MHLEYATFEEQYHNYDRARAIYDKIKKIVPGHIETTLRHIALERRQRNYSKCEELYTTALENATEETHIVFLYIHYAKMVGQVYESPRRAREVFSEGIEKCGKYKDIWMAFLHFEKTRGGPDVEERVASIYDQAIHHNKGLAETDVASLLLDWIEYCSDEGTNLPRLRDLSHEFLETHSTIYETNPPSTSATTAGVKRGLEPDPSVEPPPKAARVGEYAYESTQVAPDYSAFYSNYYGYDYGAYGYQGYGAGYDPNSGATPF